mgnify:CR=1 FL=1
MQELFIDCKDNKKTIALVENGKLQELYEEDETQKRMEGNIYLGKVKDVLNNKKYQDLELDYTMEKINTKSLTCLSKSVYLTF